MQAVSDQGGPSPRSLRIPNGIASGQALNIFFGQPVKINPITGTLVPVTLTTDPVMGVFLGCLFTPIGGRPSESPFWPAGATYDNTNDMFAYVLPAWQDSFRWYVQADGPVTQVQLGQSFNFSNITAGNTLTGISGLTVAAAGLPAGTQGQVTLVEFFPGVNSTIGDAFTDLIVSVSLPQIVSGAGPSIG